jgi:hypothetical protein
MFRRSVALAFAAGALVAGVVVSQGGSPFGPAFAADPPPGTPGAPPVDPMDPTSPGRTINPSSGPVTRGLPTTHTASEGSNGRAIAIATQAAGESIVYYFDTELDRLLVYQYIPGDRGGLKLRAARHFDYDLKLEEYHDLSDQNRNELKATYDAAFGKPGAAANGGGNQDLPVKRVASQPGK